MTAPAMTADDLEALRRSFKPSQVPVLTAALERFGYHRPLVAPSRLELILTERCNLRCRHCVADAAPSAAAELSCAELEDLLKEARAVGVTRVLLTGGEPLLRPDFPQILDLVDHLGFKATVASNLAWVSAEARRLLRHKTVTMVQTSLDGAVAATHDTVRGVSGSFAATCAAVADLVQAGVKVAVAFTVTEANVSEVEAAVDLVQALKVAAFTVNDLVCLGRARKARQRPIDAAAYQRLRELFLRRTPGSEVALLWGGAGPPRGVPPDRERKFILSRCSACLTKCAVGPDGTIYPCVFLPLSVARLGERPFAELWTGPGFARLQEREALWGRCGACDFRLGCGGCRARAYAESGDLLAPDPRCNHVPGPSMAGGEG